MMVHNQTLLSNVANDTDVRFVSVDAGAALKSRLAAMGLLPGTQFRVINNGHPGPFVIELKSARVMLGKGMAGKIYVRTIKK